MGFVALFVSGAGALAALWALGAPRVLWTMLGAALMLGAAGYAWQGRPLQAASPARPVQTGADIDPAMIALRDSLLGRFSADTAYIVAADAMTRAGEPEAAAQVMLGGVRKLPRSFTVWTWAGVTIAARDHDQMSPAAVLAFNRAMQLAPEHPAPPFYAGLAYVRARRFDEARALWARAVRLSPEGASYRREIAMRLMLLDRYLGAIRAARR